ncbi:unnamed protein product [Lepeophtheirus salmonis]|uniref:(salmon louse) hypothetical protein n=1 Tax=Lepeophtheirus salmonis TaxID=72036 RepID=A0A7R8CXL6_LEPSM|nr:unnamed protein product [Lepeophtheirus salmonis]CAF2961419.1 unnamed protein product [Lepeophtheirus salmonis]
MELGDETLVVGYSDDLVEEVIIKLTEATPQTQALTPKKGKRLGGSLLSNPIQRDLWVKSVDRTHRDGTVWTPTSSSLLCSAHFVSGQWSRSKFDVDYVPTIFSSVSASQGKKRKRTPHHESSIKIRSVLTQTDIAIIVQSTSVKTETYHNPVVHASTMTGDLVAIAVDSFSDSKFRAFTGITSKFFYSLVYNLSDSLKSSLRLSKKNKVLIFLIKLRLGLTFTVISGFFGVTLRMIKYCFMEVLEVFYNFAVEALSWPSNQEIRDKMPMDLKQCFPYCRAILHSFECDTERPRDTVKQTHFHTGNNNRYSFKFIFGIAPHGDITFISEIYGSSIGDSAALKSCSILNNLEPGDQVLSINKFREAEQNFETNQVKLVILPERHHRKFVSDLSEDASSVNLSKTASSIIYSGIEKTVKKLKAFKYLNFVPHHMTSHMNKLLVITAFLSNETPSIIVG